MNLRSRMESMSVTPETHPKRGILARLLAALVIGIGMVKAVLFVAVDYMRGLAVNPFEGFGLTQFAVAGASMALEHRRLCDEGAAASGHRFRLDHSDS